VIERGGKLDARLALARNRQDAAAAARDAKRLDVLAEVARRFLDIVAAQANERIAKEDIAQRERTATAAARRVAAGASPESVRLAAEAQLVRAQMERRRAERDQTVAYRRLALLWGERNPRASLIVGDRLSVPDVPDFDAIAALLERTPELQRFADEARIREARLQLARTARAPDVEWQIGVRRLQETSDWALVGSVSLPLGSAKRAAPEIRSAQAELAALDFERESSELTLYATLAQAHARLAASAADAHELDDELLPRLHRAEAAAEKAYRAGALSYLEWAQLQSETTVARRQQLADTIDAQRALIEIQRLTGATFGAAKHVDVENSP
jgi:cobalt-zinc-cadmium efflux system outer membrane protein